MRLSKERIHHLAQALCVNLQDEGHLVCSGEMAVLVETVEQAIAQELSVEDRLNTEIREMMKAYAHEIERGNVDYQKMFTMIKSKLVRDRGLVL